MNNILYAAAECGPFVKTGGLGAVLESLPGELDPKKYDVRVVIPGYECIPDTWKEKMENLMTIPVKLSWRSQYAVIRKLSMNEITYYFIGNDYYYCGDSPYNDIWLDIEKFSFFAKAVLELLSCLAWQPDIIHCHDWQAALIPVFLKSDLFSYDPFYNRIRTVLTVHNLRYQGITDIDRLKDITGLSDDMFTFDRLEHHGSANLLKGGISCADRITTVSRTYAMEICTPDYGEGLDELLCYRKKDLHGIVNGIDYTFYNPAKDPDIAKNYGPKTRITGKCADKEDLLKVTGMPEEEGVFTVGIISRLTEQKGFDLLEPVMDRLLMMPIQLMVLGGGQEEYVDIFRRAANKYPGRVYLNENYSDALAKKFYAGCDAVLMPSRFEPCGLSQMMALRYGAVPIVRLTGGLIDTVPVYGDSDRPVGFGFAGMDPEDLLGCLADAFKVFSDDKETWDEITLRGMKKNYSWKASCRKYEKLYQALL